MVHQAKSNKAVVQRFARDAMDPTTGEWNLDVIAEVFDVDRYFSHTWGAGLAETGRRMAQYFSAFEFIEMLNDDFIAEADFVVHRASIRVRHVGEVFGVAPTNRIVLLHSVEMWRVEDGKIIEHWGGDGEARSLYNQLTAASSRHDGIAW